VEACENDGSDGRLQITLVENQVLDNHPTCHIMQKIDFRHI